jgi:hypothetical protein
MNNEYIEKNIVYQEQVQQIAKMLFYYFYYDEQDKMNYYSEEYEKDIISDLLPTSEKIFNFFTSAEEAKKTIRFLHTVNPIKAKEIFDEL